MTEPGCRRGICFPHELWSLPYKHRLLMFARNENSIQDAASALTDSIVVLFERTASDNLNGALPRPHKVVTARANPLGLPGSASTSTSSPVDSLGSSIAGLLSSASSSLLGDLGGPAFFLGMGLGSGTAQGLNLSSPAKTSQVMQKVAEQNNMTNSSISGIAQNLGTSLSATLLMSMNTSLAANIDIGVAVLSLAQGLGNGTSSGLKLSTVQKAPKTSNASTVADYAGIFGYGLSDAMTSNLQLPSFSSLVSSAGGSGGLSKMIVPAASGFGSGLGEGIPIGLGLQRDTNPVMTDSTNVVGMASQQFAKGFTSRFLANGTVQALMSQMGGSSLLDTSNINVLNTAEGFARGLMQGVGDGVQTIKMVAAMPQLAAKLDQSRPPQSSISSPTPFNDSVGGAAVGFGYGFGNQGTLVVAKLIQSPSSSLSTLSNTNTTTKRSLLIPRSDLTVQTRALDPNNLNLTSLLATSNISALAQNSIDALTCQGVGGLLNIFLGLIQFKTLNPSAFAGQTGPNSTFAMLKSMLPNGTVEVKSEGNTYAVDLPDGGNVRVNGMPVVRFAVVLILHGLFYPSLSHHMSRLSEC